MEDRKLLGEMILGTAKMAKDLFYIIAKKFDRDTVWLNLDKKQGISLSVTDQWFVELLEIDFDQSAMHVEENARVCMPVAEITKKLKVNDADRVKIQFYTDGQGYITTIDTLDSRDDVIGRYEFRCDKSIEKPKDVQINYATTAIIPANIFLQFVKFAKTIKSDYAISTVREEGMDYVVLTTPPVQTSYTVITINTKIKTTFSGKRGEVACYDPERTLKVEKLLSLQDELTIRYSKDGVMRIDMWYLGRARFYLAPKIIS